MKVTNDAQAIQALEGVLEYLRRKEFRESGRPAPDFSGLGVQVKPPDED